jgi:histidine phosphotransfer protein HptB
MTAPTIDLATFEALQQTTGEEFVAELVATFLTEAPIMLAALRTGLEAHDAAVFRRAAHSLKSNASTFGALTLGAMARELELSAQTSPLDSKVAADPAQLDTLEQEYARAAAALTELTRA